MEGYDVASGLVIILKVCGLACCIVIRRRGQGQANVDGNEAQQI